MSTIHDSPFLRRFDALWARLRRVQLGQTLTVWGLAVLAGLVLLIAADFWLELPWAWRATGMAFAVLAAVGVAGVLVRAFLRSGTRPRTASEIERSFPQLGQSVRTAVQYGEATHDQVRAAGVREALVTALEEDTHQRSRPLHLDSIVPTRKLWVAVGGLIAAVVVLAGALGLSWEWRVAASRALLANTPYTELSVLPGNVKVDQGAPVEIQLSVAGRTARDVRLMTRPADDPQAGWTEREFSADEGASGGPRTLAFATRLESVKKPMEYKAIAGPAESPVYRIDVRYPLALKKVEVELTPPAYTNHPPRKTEDANITAVEGTTAKFRITLDQPPRTASLVLTDLGRRDEDEQVPESRTLPLEVDGQDLSVTLPLSTDMKYSIVAETSEGQRLPENSYRIRIRPDQPPEVYFEEPRDPLDVHTLAEVLMRIRVRDDFGLARAGIIFEVNNEEEYPLLSEDFATAAEELKTLGKLMPDTQAALEKVLPLEFFELKMTDSVAYYAFAEDNYPGTPHRTVTDLRFVDIRPFRIRYAMRDDPNAPSDGMPGPKLASLEELIKRQRFNLNRSMNVARRAERNEKVDLGAIDGVVTSEAEIAQATRQLADFLGNLMIEDLNDEIQLLLQAEAHMLAAADSLAAGKYDTSVLQQRDALKELIEGRNRLREEIQKNPARFKGLGAADRRIAQKLRRPKSDNEEAQEVVRRLKQLATEQSEVQSGLMASAEQSGNAGQGEPMETAEPMKASTPETEAPSNAPEPTEEKKTPPMDSAAPEPKSGTPKEGDGPAEGQAGMSREALKEQQLDNVLEAQDLEKMLGKLKNITDLAKERMSDATKSIEGANAALERGDSPETIAESGKAVATLNELAKQVEALIKDEAADKLNEARQIAAQLAEAQQQLASRTPNPSGMGKTDMPPEEPMKGDQPKGAGSPNPSEKPADMPGEGGGGSKNTDQKPPAGKSGSGAGSEMNESSESGNGEDHSEQDRKERGEGLAEDAERNAETGKTVVDILESILKSTDPADKDVIAKVDAILKENKLKETLDRMGMLPDQLREGRFGDAQVTAEDSADRWEAAANRLNVAFREVAAPKLQDLMEIERQLQTLQEQLENLGTERDVVEWHVAAGKLMEKLDDIKVGGGVREKLEELMKQAGWSENVEQFRLTGGGWVLNDDDRSIAVPTGYGMAIRDVTREVQAHIQELILGDLLATGSELTPPQYEKLVERYYEVLAKEKRPEAK